MSQPAKVKNLRAVAKGRVVPDGPKAQVKWDLLENNEYLTGQHQPDDVRAAQDTATRLPQIEELEREGRYSKADRVRREVNLATEARWAVRSSWCPTCINVFHNCTCPLPDMPDRVDVDFIQSIFGRETKEEAKTRRKEEAKAKRKARKEKMKNNGHV